MVTAFWFTGCVQDGIVCGMAFQSADDDGSSENIPMGIVTQDGVVFAVTSQVPFMIAGMKYIRMPEDCSHKEHVLPDNSAFVMVFLCPLGAK